MRSILKSIIAAGLCLGIVFSTGVGAYAAFPKTQSEIVIAELVCPKTDGVICPEQLRLPVPK